MLRQYFPLLVQKYQIINKNLMVGHFSEQLVPCKLVDQSCLLDPHSHLPWPRWGTTTGENVTRACPQNPLILPPIWEEWGFQEEEGPPEPHDFRRVLPTNSRPDPRLCHHLSHCPHINNNINNTSPDMRAILETSLEILNFQKPPSWQSTTNRRNGATTITVHTRMFNFTKIKKLYWMLDIEIKILFVWTLSIFSWKIKQKWCIVSYWWLVEGYCEIYVGMLNSPPLNTVIISHVLFIIFIN